jgi:surfactin synthase thioesterase subunit
MPTSKFARQVAVAEPRTRLFCFPFAGGSAVMFAGWGERLKPEIEVWTALPRGRGMRFREMPFKTAAAMVEEYLSALRPFLESRPNLPFAFYGHSLGGLLAFEITRRLQAEGLPMPAQVFVGASTPPHLGVIHEEIHHLPDPEFVMAIQERYAGIPAEVLKEPELMEIFLPALKADFAAYEQYRFEEMAPICCSLTAFAGASDKGIAPELIEEWGRHTEGEFLLRTVPGDHFFLTTSAEAVLGAIRESLSLENLGRASLNAAGVASPVLG